MEAMQVSASPQCLQHAGNPVTAYCVRCGRPVCELCTFWVGSALFCPECISSGPSADERSSVFTRGLASIGLAVLAFLFLAAVLVLSRSGLPPAAARALNFADYPILGASLGGVAVGLIAREGATRTGSMLPLIGIICNAAVLAVELVFSTMASEPIPSRAQFLTSSFPSAPAPTTTSRARASRSWSHQSMRPNRENRCSVSLTARPRR